MSTSLACKRRRFLALVLLCGGTLSAQQVLRSLYTETAVIAISTSLSAAVDLKNRPMVGIIVPSAWTTAQITFQVSVDGTTFVNLYNTQGDEFISEASANRFVAISPFDFLPVRYVKIRSGTSGTPVNQAAARTLTLVTRMVGQ